MAAMSNWLENQLINKIFRTTDTWTKPATLAIALCTAATTDADDGSTITEVADDHDYARFELAPADANWDDTSGTDGTTANTDDIEFPAANGGDWGTITHIAILDSTTHGAGNVLFHGALVAAKTVNDGDTFRFSAGDLSVQIDN